MTASLVPQYAAALQRLLPEGRAWPRHQAAVLTQLLISLAEEFAKVHGHAQDLVRESHPDEAFELIAEWEAAVGLPDPCIGEPGSLQGRRNLVVARLVHQGGQTPQFYVDLAAILGFEIEVEEYRAFRSGFARSGDRITNGDWAHTWAVHAPEETGTFFRSGQSVSGERLATWGNHLLECVIERAKPSHSHVLFLYDLSGGAQWVPW